MLFLEINKLKPHALAVSLVPRMTEIEYSSFLEDIKKNGILTPIEVIIDSNIAIDDADDNNYLIVDGVHRYNAAVELNFKKLPATIIKTDKISIEDYIISKTVTRRNISKTQRAALAAEWICKQDNCNNDNADRLVKIASKKFGVSRNIISIVYDIKKSIPNIFILLKEGSLSYKDSLKYFLKKDTEEYSLIKEFINLPKNLKEHLRKVPFDIQEEIYQKILNNNIKTDEQDIDKGVSRDIVNLSEKEHEIRELTDKYINQKEKENKIKQELKQAEKYQEKLENLIMSMRVLVKNISSEKENTDSFLIKPINKAETTDLINEINALKKQLNDLTLEKDYIVNNNIESITNDKLLKLKQLYVNFLNFTSVFDDYNVNQVINTLKDVSFIDQKSYNQILYFLSKLYNFLDLLFNEFSIMAINNKRIDKSDKFFIISGKPE